jgi:hypothetical protein
MRGPRFGKLNLTAKLLQKTAGSQEFFTRASGKDAQEAYRNAIQAAEREYGHREGYSGQINSARGGFIMIQPPPGVKPIKYAEWVMDGDREQLRDVREAEYKNGMKCPGAQYQKCDGTIVMEPGQWPKCTKNHPLNTTGHGGKFYYHKSYKIKPELEQKIRADNAKINDKYKPCGCIQLSKNQFVFFGWAPS